MVVISTYYRHNKRSFCLFLCFVFSCILLLYYLHSVGTGGGDGVGYYYFFSSTTKKPTYQWKPEFTDLNGNTVKFDDKRLLKKLAERHMHKWTTSNYNLTNSSIDYDPSMGQSQIVRQLFEEDDRKNKFFVECGALDGELRSNTLYLERALGWQGLLIEADPENFRELEWKRRKSWASDACLSTTNYPTMVSFEQKVNQGKISAFTAGYVEKGFVDVQCYPFATYMTYLNRSRVDYFSLDVEGLELAILKTIDFTKYDITVLSVEFIHDKEGKEAIRDFMESKGYYVHSEVTHPNWLANDFIFVKTESRESLNKIV